MYFVYASTIVFLFLMLIWSHKTWLNFGLKFLFACMFIAGGIESLTLLGYIVAPL